MLREIKGLNLVHVASDAFIPPIAEIPTEKCLQKSYFQMEILVMITRMMKLWSKQAWPFSQEQAKLINFKSIKTVDLKKDKAPASSGLPHGKPNAEPAKSPPAKQPASNDPAKTNRLKEAPNIGGSSSSQSKITQPSALPHGTAADAKGSTGAPLHGVARATSEDSNKRARRDRPRSRQDSNRGSNNSPRSRSRSLFKRRKTTSLTGVNLLECRAVFRLHSRMRQNESSRKKENYASGVALRSTSEIRHGHKYRPGNEVTLVSRASRKATKAVLKKNTWIKVIRQLAKKSARRNDTFQV